MFCSSRKNPKRSKSKNKAEKLTKKRLKQLANTYNFTEAEILMIKKRFDKLSVGGDLDIDTFKNGLGLLGLDSAAFLCERIFNVIDENANDSVNFDEFLRYMHILIDGSYAQKAKQSFRMLAFNKDIISYDDIEKMIYGMSVLWNSLTGSKVFPAKSYIQRVFNAFDQDGDGKVTFQDFMTVYKGHGDAFGWFEYLNQEDGRSRFLITLEEDDEEDDFDPSSPLSPVRSRTRSPTKKEIESFQEIEGKFSMIEEEITNCLSLLDDYERKNSFHENKSFSQNIAHPSLYTQEIEEQVSLKKLNHKGGPLGQSIPMEDFDGDDSPPDDENYEEEKSNGPMLVMPNSGSNGSDNNRSRLFSFNNTPQNKSKTKSGANIENINKRLQHLLEMTKNIRSNEMNAIQSFRENSKYSKDEYLLNPGFDRKDSSPFSINLSKIPSQDEYETTNYTNGNGVLRQQSSTLNNKMSGSLREDKRANTVMRINQNNMKANIISEHSSADPFARRKSHFSSKLKVQKNVSVFFGHENWNIVLNMMIGIRTSTKNIYTIRHKEDNKLNEKDFKVKAVFELVRHRTEDVEVTDLACQFADYAPLVFNDIRRKNGITSETFLRAVGPENLLGNLIRGNMSSLTEQTSAGKSGSFFYYSEDGKFMLKTISKNEFVLLKKALKRYYEHLTNHPDSLIIRIYGLYNMSFTKKNKKKNIHFIVMGNLFHTDLDIQFKYDLKGSTHGRTARKKGVIVGPTTILKDKDFNDDGVILHLPEIEREMFKKQIEIDSKFLASINVNDYSLLVGIHMINPHEEEIDESPKESKGNGSPRKKSLANQLGLHTLSTSLQDQAEPFYRRYKGGMLSKDKKKIYVLGIIDILTYFGTKKKFEYGFKRTFIGKTISCLPPKAYSERFRQYLFKKIE